MGSCIRNLRLFHTMTLKSVFFGQFEAPPRVICANVIRNPEAERLGEPRNSLSPGRLRSTMSRRTSQSTIMSVLLGHSDRGWLLGPYESCQIARNPSISARTIASILSYSLQRFRVRFSKWANLRTPDRYPKTRIVHAKLTPPRKKRCSEIMTVYEIQNDLRMTSLLPLGMR